MPNLVQRLSLQMKQSPQQVLLSSLLQLPILSLEQKIKVELETNPLLEMDEEMEMNAEEEVVEVVDPDKEEESKEDDAVDDFEKEEIDCDAILNDEETYEYRAPRDDSAEVFERPEVAQTTLPEHLLSQLHMTKMGEQDLIVGEYIIWNIREDGYLGYPVEIIAENLEVDVDDVEKVLKEIQLFDPIGIGSRNLQECLLIQILETEGRTEIATEIIRDHFDDFTNKRYERIIKKMGIDLDDIRDSIDEITKLNPKPGDVFQNHGLDVLFAVFKKVVLFFNYRLHNPQNGGPPLVYRVD